MEQISRGLTNANASFKVVATLGVVLTVNFLAPTMLAADLDIQDIPAGSGAGKRATWLPKGGFELGGVRIGYDRLIIMIVGVVSAIGLTVFLRRTRIGVQMRAVVDDPDLLALEGTNPVAVRRTAWILGSTFAAVSGVLLAPSLGQNFGAVSSLVVKSAGAAALGAFASFPLAFIGGLLIGVAESVLTKQVSSQQNFLVGLPQAVPFIVLFVALLAIPRKKLRDTFFPLPHRDRVLRQVPQWLQIGPLAAVLAALLLIPVFVQFPGPYTRFLSYVLLFLSMGLLVKTSGQLSLGHFGFAAVGAAMFHHFAASQHLPWLLALVLAGLVAVPVGALIAIPAVRLSGIFLALATYAFAIALEALFYRTNQMFGTSTQGVFLPRPSLAHSDKGYFYLVLGVVIVCMLLMTLIDRGRLGRLLRALGESPSALETQGTTVNVVRTAVFCISAFFAAISGALIGATNVFASGSDYSAEIGLILLVLVMLAPGRQPWFAIWAALGLAILRNDIDLGKIGFLDINLTFQLIFGFLATRGAMRAYRRHKATATTTLWNRIADRFAPRVEVPVATAVDKTEAVRIGGGHQAQGSGLEAREVTVRYGSLVAVDSLSLSAPTGRITGLVGPNGAGKSTTFDACSGLVQPSSGHVLLNGREVTNLGSAERARLGIGRTFQRVRLWNGMTVEQNVALGREGAMAGRSPIAQLAATRRQRQEITESTDNALDACGISHLRRQVAGGLTTGQRRLVELARCLAGRYDLLLLDEPSSGLDTQETDRFGEILKAVVRERGCGILLVEHDMNLVMDVCDYIYVLDVGRLIFEGTAEEVRSSPIVQAAYLGSSAAVAPAAAPVN